MEVIGSMIKMEIILFPVTISGYTDYSVITQKSISFEENLIFLNIPSVFGQLG